MPSDQDYPTERDLRQASTEQRMAPLQRQVDEVIAAMPRWQRALFRVVVAMRRRLP